LSFPPAGEAAQPSPNTLKANVKAHDAAMTFAGTPSPSMAPVLEI
jgi:hypothetical protein